MLTLMVGLPGSGKSTWARSQRDSHSGSLFYEDFLGAHKPLNKGTGLFDLLEAVRNGQTIFADDIFLCRSDYRQTFQTMLAPFVPTGYEVHWVYFANSPEVCRRNVDFRERGKHGQDRHRHAIEWIQKLTSRYAIPDGVEVHPVVDHGV